MRFDAFTDPAVEAAQLVDAHRTLDEHLRQVGPIDPARPSRLEGWSIGHVLTHLARNADSHRSMLQGRDQYAGGWDGRDRAIGGGAARSWAELCDDVASSSLTLDRTYAAEADWDRSVRMLGGDQPAGFLPLARRREVELHRVDLGLGSELGDIALDFVERDMSLLEAWWVVKEGPAANGLPAPIVALPLRARWAWLTGRLAVDGVDAAGLF